MVQILPKGLSNEALYASGLHIASSKFQLSDKYAFTVQMLDQTVLGRKNYLCVNSYVKFSVSQPGFRGTLKFRHFTCFVKLISNKILTKTDLNNGHIQVCYSEESIIGNYCKSDVVLKIFLRKKCYASKSKKQKCPTIDGLNFKGQI